MTKNEFLRELENSLRGQLPTEDISEIIADYSDVFDNGKREGKNENEVSDEIGSPANIARTILEDVNTNGGRPNSFKSAPVDTSNLAPMSKRLGAYVIDTLATSLILALIMFAAVIPYQSISSVGQAQRIVENGTVQPAPTNQYREQTTIYRNGNSKIIELYENNKRIFKGTEEEYNKILKNKGITKSDISSFTTITKMPFSVMNLLAVFPIALLIMFLGFSNIITALELWIFRGYTLGKWMTKIKVENINDSRITFWEAILRDALIKSIGNSVTSGILNIASFIWGCATPEHKTVHDLAAKTRVVNTMR